LERSFPGFVFALTSAVQVEQLVPLLSLLSMPNGLQYHPRQGKAAALFARG